MRAHEPSLELVQIWAQLGDMKEEQYEMYLYLSTLLQLCMEHQLFTKDEWEHQLRANFMADAGVHAEEQEYEA